MRIGIPKRVIVGSVALTALAIALAATMWIAVALDDRDGGGAPKPVGEGEWLPGLPIDTPPAEESPVLATAPEGEEAQWEAVAKWAASSCDQTWGAPSSASPTSMFKTSAGEIRRRVAAAVPEIGNPLGSNWRNNDTVFVVVFRGTFIHPPGTPLAAGRSIYD